MLCKSVRELGVDAADVLDVDEDIAHVVLTEQAEPTSGDLHDRHGSEAYTQTPGHRSLATCHARA